MSRINLSQRDPSPADKLTTKRYNQLLELAETTNFTFNDNELEFLDSNRHREVWTIKQRDWINAMFFRYVDKY